jgi:hypothetical protein
MRKFSSYGLVDKDLNYYAPREELIQKACRQLVGEDFDKGGHYITVWAPRQTGKSWLMYEVLKKIRQSGQFEAGFMILQSAKTEETDEGILDFFVTRLGETFSKQLPLISSWKELSRVFSKPYFQKPVILIMDEFDALKEDFINKFANEFREMYIKRQTESDKSGTEKQCLLHGIALIGVRSVLGIENLKGSPFNVQRSMRIPNLTVEEVDFMFKWYEKESGQSVEQAVIDRIFYETQGQPGLVSWFGELLTETYNIPIDKPISIEHFEYVFKRAVQALPNNNIINIISKAKQEPYRKTVLEIYKTEHKPKFTFDDPCLSFLYMNGVIDIEEGDDLYVKFSCPFVQKRLFNYFSHELFPHMGKLYEPFEDVKHIISEDYLHVRNLMRRYENHLQKNREWMLKEAPRRSDLRIYEAVFHFNLYEYLVRFFGSYRTTKVWPEFPTGNGKVDILIRHGGKLHALEIKSYKDEPAFHQAVQQAARYAKSLGQTRIHLIVFVESIPDDIREKYEADCPDKETGVTVSPVFVATGE